MFARGVRAAAPAHASLRRAVAAFARKVECRHILCDTADDLQGAAVRIESGEDFADVAREVSQCPSKGAGGRIGWVLPGMADSSIERAVLDKPVGSLTQVESTAGHHLIEVLAESTAEGPGSAAMAAPAQPRPPYASASVQQLHEVLSDPAKAARAQFIDVRERHEIDLASIPQFEVYPLSSAATWVPTIGDELCMDADTYVLCHAGVRSAHVCRILAAQGWTSLYNVSGGIARWSADVDPSVPQY